MRFFETMVGAFCAACTVLAIPANSMNLLKTLIPSIWEFFDEV